MDSMKNTDVTKNFWCDESTRLILDKYEQYLPLVGPMKQFKCKKAMWEQIADDISTEMNISRTATQCENRFKTILKRKKECTRHNQQSGSKRIRVEYEEEINKIKAIDDSLEPEILQSAGKIIENNKENIKSNKIEKKKKSLSISETLLAIQKDKEEKREKRHKEKLEMLQNFINIFARNENDVESD